MDDIVDAIIDNPLIGIAAIAVIVLFAWLVWRTEMKPQPPPDGDHWQRPKPWQGDKPK